MKAKVTFRNRYILLFDLLVIVASVFGAFAVRFELGEVFFYYCPWPTG
jgi:hypothetical protein